MLIECLLFTVSIHVYRSHHCRWKKIKHLLGKYGLWTWRDLYRAKHALSPILLLVLSCKEPILTRISFISMHYISSKYRLFIDSFIFYQTRKRCCYNINKPIAMKSTMSKVKKVHGQQLFRNCWKMAIFLFYGRHLFINVWCLSRIKANHIFSWRHTSNIDVHQYPGKIFQQCKHFLGD